MSGPITSALRMRARRMCNCLNRHWEITDAMGRRQEVKGPGVVGKQPVLRPGESFEYTSGTPLSTPFGHYGRHVSDGNDHHWRTVHGGHSCFFVGQPAPADPAALKGKSYGYGCCRSTASARIFCQNGNGRLGRVKTINGNIRPGTAKGHADLEKHLPSVIGEEAAAKLLEVIGAPQRNNIVSLALARPSQSSPNTP